MASKDETTPEKPEQAFSQFLLVCMENSVYFFSPVTLLVYLLMYTHFVLCFIYA